MARAQLALATLVRAGLEACAPSGVLDESGLEELEAYVGASCQLEGSDLVVERDGVVIRLTLGDVGVDAEMTDTTDDEDITDDEDTTGEDIDADRG